MAKITLSGGFSLMDEGIYVFRIKSCNYNEDFGKLRFILERQDGKTIVNDYDFGADGTKQKAINSFSFFARTVLGSTSIDEVDPEDLVGKYVRGEVYHNTSMSLDANGKPKEYANLRNWEVAYGFDGDNQDVSLDDILDI